MEPMAAQRSSAPAKCTNCSHDLQSPAVCEHCASGCGQRTDHRRGKVLRRLAGDDPEVNEEWNCDKGRWAFTYARQRDRLSTPMIRGEGGGLVPASWSTAQAAAATGLTAARGRAGVLTGGRLTVEDAYAYAKFARTVMHTNDVDFRARHHSAEEAAFLADRVVGTSPATGSVTYADLETAPVVLLVGFDPEEESPIVFLRLRRCARDLGLPVFAIAPYASRGVRKTSATLLPTVPGTEPQVLDALAAAGPDHDVLATLLRQPGAVIMAGERLGGIPGALTAAVALADATGARLAWVPRRAGERGAIEAGCLPTLLPGGRPVTDDAARRALADLWRCDALPTEPGRSTAEQLDAARAGELDALLIAGVEAADLPDPRAALEAVDAAGFVVSIELRRSEITDRADVVLPIAPVAEKSGTFLTWEGRPRPFEAALTRTDAMADLRVLTALAEESGAWFGLPDVESARRELDAVRAASAGGSEAASVGGGGGAGDTAGTGGTTTTTTTTTTPSPTPRPEPAAGQAVLATWRMLLDEGRLQDGEPHLAGTARRPVARMCATTAAEIAATDGEPVTVSTDLGAITLPLAITEMPERVVWVPQNSPGSQVGVMLGTAAGEVVTIAAGAESTTDVGAVAS